MILLVNIKQIGSRKNKIAPVPFAYKTCPKTARELITETVKICVEDYNMRIRRDDAGVPLTREEIADKAQVGKIAFGINYGGREANFSAALENALQSFEDGIYRVFAGEAELCDLSQEIALSENDAITFIRLTMLSGRIW